MKDHVTVTTGKGTESKDYYKRKVQEERDLTKMRECVNQGNGRSLELPENGEWKGMTGD